MPHIGLNELLILLVIVLILFGSTRLPKLARSIGEARRELRPGETEERLTREPKRGAPEPSGPGQR